MFILLFVFCSIIPFNNAVTIMQTKKGITFASPMCIPILPLLDNVNHIESTVVMFQTELSLVRVIIVIGKDPLI